MDWQQARLGVQQEWHAQAQTIRIGRIEATFAQLVSSIDAIQADACHQGCSRQQLIRDARHLEDAIRADLQHLTDRTTYEHRLNELAQKLSQTVIDGSRPTAIA